MFHKADCTNIKQELQSIDWDKTFSTKTNVTSMTDFFMTLLKSLSKICPYVYYIQ